MRTRRFFAQVAALAAISVATAALGSPLTSGDAPPRMRPGPSFYPPKAQSHRVEGYAVALCRVGPNLELINCRVQTESPAGYGFGDAILKLAALVQVPPQTLSGAPTRGRPYLFDITFKLPRSAPR